MPQSSNTSAVEAYQGYVQDFHDQLIGKAFYSPTTVAMAQQAGSAHEGVKGKKTLTLISEASDVTRAGGTAGTFQPVANAITLSPRTIETVPVKRDLNFNPQSFESSYLGAMRGKGQNPGTDLPFEGYIIERQLAKNAVEIDYALWRGVKAGSIVEGTTPMRQCFDGYLEIIADAITGGLPTVATPGGAITTSNAVALVETMWDSLADAYKKLPVYIYCSFATYKKYMTNYRDAFGKYVSDNKEAMVRLDFGTDAMLIPHAALTGSNRIIMTPAENLHVAYDDFAETGFFNFEKNKRIIEFWMDFKIGAQIAQIDSDLLIVNDLA